MLQVVQHRKHSWQTKVTPAQDWHLQLIHLWDRFRTATSTASQIPGLRQSSSQTIINRLCQAGLQARQPVWRNVLTVHHLTEQIWWGQEHIWWRHAQCRTVLFSNESHLIRADRCSRIYQSHNERYAANCVLEHCYCDGGSVMVWAGIHHNGHTVLIRVTGMLIV